MPNRSNSNDTSSHDPSVGRRPMPDSFDKPKKLRRVGAHRLPPKRGAVWMRVLWIAVATAVLTAVGIVIFVIGPQNLLFPQADTSNQEASTADQTQQVKAKIDPATTVTVLNGTTTPGLGDEVSTIITEDELGTVSYVGNAADQTATISAVFYTQPEDEGLAKGLGEKLGGIFYYLREEYASYGTQLVVLIGSDYESTGRTPQPSETPSPSESE